MQNHRRENASDGIITRLELCIYRPGQGTKTETKHRRTAQKLETDSNVAWPPSVDLCPWLQIVPGVGGGGSFATIVHYNARVNALCNLSRKKSREVAASLPSRFLSWRYFTLCITTEIEPRIAKQYNCQHCCSCKTYRGKGVEGGKKMSLRRVFFLLIRRSRVRGGEKNAFWGTSNELLLVARHILTTGLQKKWL